MSSDLLRRAAQALRERALAATPGPWTVASNRSVLAEAGPNCHVMPSIGGEHDWPSRADAEYIASMHPPVALLLADLLKLVAELRDEDGINILPETTEDIARAILRETPS